MAKVALEIPDGIADLPASQKEQIVAQMIRSIGVIVTTRKETSITAASYIVGMTIALGAMLGVATPPDLIEEATTDTINLFKHWIEKGQEQRKQAGFDAPN